MHVDDGSGTRFLSTKIEKGEYAASVVSVPMGNHNALDWDDGRAKSSEIAR